MYITNKKKTKWKKEHRILAISIYSFSLKNYKDLIFYFQIL